MDQIKFPTTVQIAGLKQKFRSYELSSGLESFDVLFGNSIPCSSLICIEENNSKEYGELLCKYSIAEGIANRHSIFIANCRGSTEDTILQKVPAKTSQTNLTDRRDLPAGDMKIAWRYNTANQINSSLAKVHRFDIHDTLTDEEVANYPIKYFESSTSYKDLWAQIKEKVLENQSLHNKKNVVRIIIKDIGLYDDPEFFLKFLQLLKLYTRDLHALIYLIVNTNGLPQYEQEALLDISNAYFVLEAFASTKGFFDKFDGRLIIKRLPTITSAAQFKPVSVDLVFQKHKRYLDIRIFHLPPALGAEDDVGAGGGCQSVSNGNKKAKMLGCGGAETQF
uniref:Elongator complex protein 4 n=1 Tax=Rhabditophanes sp. KR3021 TaxID=114890 RepID=A0AC35TJQ9_9BILA